MRSAIAAYDRRRHHAVAAGTWLYPEPAVNVQKHIDLLISQGMSYSQIATAAGVAERTVRGVRKRSTLRGMTAAAILAVQPQPRPARADLVPNIGTMRRVQALVALGWSLTELGARSGMPVQQVWDLAHGRKPQIKATTRGRIDDLFEQLSATPGTSRRARACAAKRGWLPPLAWDDIDALDCRAEPVESEAEGDVVDEVAVERALAGHRIELTDAELVAVLQVGVARGEPLSKLSNRLGVNYAGARQMLGGELTIRREKQARVEAAIKRMGDTHSDYVLAGLLDVNRSTVSRARQRLAEQQKQLAS